MHAYAGLAFWGTESMRIYAGLALWGTDSLRIYIGLSFCGAESIYKGIATWVTILGLSMIFLASLGQSKPFWAILCESWPSWTCAILDPPAPFSANLGQSEPVCWAILNNSEPSWTRDGQSIACIRFEEAVKLNNLYLGLALV